MYCFKILNNPKDYEIIKLLSFHKVCICSIERGTSVKASEGYYKFLTCIKIHQSLDPLVSEDLKYTKPFFFCNKNFSKNLGSHICKRVKRIDTSFCCIKSHSILDKQRERERERESPVCKS